MLKSFKDLLTVAHGREIPPAQIRADCLVRYVAVEV